MNPDKAREYFSAYHEGTLEKGLSETLERALRSDAQLQAEYRSFERLMTELSVLQEPVPEPEFELHELISRRLDKHIFDQKQKVRSPLLGWWKSLAMGGLATVALGAAFLQLQNGGLSNGKSATANVVAPVETLDKVELVSGDSGYGIEYRTRETRTLILKSADGAELAKQSIDSGTLRYPLSNPNPTSRLLQVEVLEEPGVTFIALPGTRMQPASQGEGTVKDLALALSGFYRVAVLISEADETPLTWKFNPGEGLAAAEKALSSTGYTVHKSPDGSLSIQLNK